MPWVRQQVVSCTRCSIQSVCGRACLSCAAVRNTRDGAALYSDSSKGLCTCRT